MLLAVFFCDAVSHCWCCTSWLHTDDGMSTYRTSEQHHVVASDTWGLWMQHTVSAIGLQQARMQSEEDCSTEHDYVAFEGFCSVSLHLLCMHQLYTAVSLLPCNTTRVCITAKRECLRVVSYLWYKLADIHACNSRCHVILTASSFLYYTVHMAPPSTAMWPHWSIATVSHMYNS